MDTLSWPARAPKIIRQRSATCCGVPYDDSHFSSCVRSAGSNWIAMLVFGMSEIIATTGNAVKLFKGHDTRCRRFTVSGGIITGVVAAGGCQHVTGADLDHGAVTVQLFPFNETP